MTNREKEILKWIMENPMISQQELADKAGITRSSAAVHISNLMKKGYIAGKGYVISQPDYAVVVGGINKDIGGNPFDPLVRRDSNPGTVTVSIGGVGRNIAHNMSLLGVPVKMLTALGDDDFTAVIERSCSNLGIDISNALRVRNQHNATYLFINDSKGDMDIAVSDMKFFDNVTPEYLAGNIQLLNNSQLVVADTNIPQDSLEWLGNNVKVPLFIDPVSTIKAKKITGMMDKIHTIKPNKLEAEFLSDVNIYDEKTLRWAANRILDKGVKRVFISLGREGVYCAEGDHHVHLPCPRCKVINATGAGDAFMAALAWSFIEDRSLEDAAKLATGAAALAVESEQTINPEMSIKATFKKAGMKKTE